MSLATEIPIPKALDDAFAKEWSFLAAPGTWFSGGERVEIAAEARRAMTESLSDDRRGAQAVSGEPSASRPERMAGEPAGEGLPPALRDVVDMVASSSPLIDADWVAGLDERNVTLPAYAEIIGIASRMSAVDFFHRALGLPLPPLPEPQAGEPTLLPPPTDLIVGKSFLPMVPPVSIPQTISLVPPETQAWQALSDATYMTFDEMGDPDLSRSLHRTQIELVAARTSQVNECFY